MLGDVICKINETPIEPSYYPPVDVTNLNITVGDKQLTISWNDPDDVENGVWAGSKLVRKVGGYPISEEDGTVVVDSTVRNQYSTGYIDTNLINGETYYYQVFPYSDKGKVNTNETNRVSGTPIRYWILGVAIDETNSNPETAVTYTDDAVGMTPASHGDDGMMVTGQEFLDLFKVRPCVLGNGNGVVQYYLNPNNYNEKEDGEESDLTGADGNVMVEIPKIGYKFNRVGNILNIQLTNKPDAEGFCYLAHTRGSTVKDKLYIGAYISRPFSVSSFEGFVSCSGRKPTTGSTSSVYRQYSQANGEGYNTMGFYQLTLLQCMYLIMYKNLNSQTALGRGYTSSNNTETIATGGTNAKGMCFGEQTGNLQMKFLGIEDFWGNASQLIDGMYVDNSYNIKTATENFNDTGDGYPYVHPSGLSGNTMGYLVIPQGTNNTGFCIKNRGGSSSTFYADGGFLRGGGYLYYFGGSWNDGLSSGAFCTKAYLSTSSSKYCGSRLMYL